MRQLYFYENFLVYYNLINRNFRKKVNPRYRRYTKDGEPGYFTKDPKELDKMFLSPHKTNRRKRKDEKRYGDRKIELERLSRRTELIKKLTHADSSFSFGTFEFILTIYIGQELEFESFPTVSSNPVAYLEDLIRNYADCSDLEVEQVTDIVIYTESSKETPVTSEESEILKALMCQLFPSAIIHSGQAINESAGSEIYLSLNFINR